MKTKIEKLTVWQNAMYKLMTISAVISGLVILTMEAIGAIQWIRIGYAATVSWWQTVSWGPVFRVTSLAVCTTTLVLFGICCVLSELKDKAWADYEAGE